MWRLADQLIDEFVADERCEFASVYGQPFPLLAGKGPAEDPGWAQRDEDGRVNMNPIAYLDKWLTAYISDRRDTPTRDILTEMATQRFADGSLPEVVDMVRIATFLFLELLETES